MIGSVAAARKGRRVRTPPGLIPPASHVTLFFLSLRAYNSIGSRTASVDKRSFETVCKHPRLRAGTPPGGGWVLLTDRLFLSSSNARISDTVYRGPPTSLGLLPEQTGRTYPGYLIKSRLCHGATWWSRLNGRRLFFRTRWVSPTSSAVGADGPKAVSRSLGDNIASRFTRGPFSVTVCRDME